MPYRQSGHHARFLRVPDLRLDDLFTVVETIAEDDCRIWGAADRAFYLHALMGRLRLERPRHAAIILGTGDSIGVERGPDLKLTAITGGAKALISSVPRRYAYIANLPEDVILIPAERPAAVLLQAISSAIVVELEREQADPEILRRLCETIMLQLVRYVRAGITAIGQPPEAILHDEHILRAWSAYFSDPAAAWTVEKLADAAGLSRSAFFDRFRATFEAPPLETLTRIRLEHAKQLLRDSKASLAQIANEVGYQSETALIRAFKREFGASPGKWRKSSRDA